MLRWNLIDLVGILSFDLGIGEEWLPKYPDARVSTSVNILNQGDLTNDDDAEFRQRIGATKGNNWNYSKLSLISSRYFHWKSPVPRNQNKVKPAHFHNVKLVEWM